MFREVHIFIFLVERKKKGRKEQNETLLWKVSIFKGSAMPCFAVWYACSFLLYGNAISAASVMVVTIILCIIHVGYSFSPEGFIWKYKYEYLCWWQYASFSIDLVKNEGWIHPLPSKTSVYCQDCFCNLFAQCNFQFLFPIHSFIMKR